MPPNLTQIRSLRESGRHFNYPKHRYVVPLTPWELAMMPQPPRPRTLMEKIQQTLNTLTGKIDGMAVHVGKISGLLEEVKRLNNILEQKEDMINKLEKRVDELEQYTRKEDVIKQRPAPIQK
ncbi:unnamed protein product [Merluccius merluccius]